MTPPLLDRLGSLRAKAKRYEEVTTVAKSLRQYEQVHAAFAPVSTALATCVALRDVLSNAGLAVPDAEPSGTLVGSDVLGLRTRFLADPATVIDPTATQERNQVLIRLQNVSDGWLAQVRDTWSAHVAGLIPPLDTDVLRVLGRVPAFTDSVRFIEDGLRELEAWRERLPQDAQALERVETLAREVQATWASLAGAGTDGEVGTDGGAEGNLDPAVIDFLQAAGDSGAPLALLTEPVSAWLEQHGLTDAFAITMRVGRPGDRSVSSTASRP